MHAFLGTLNADQGMKFLPIHLPPGWPLFGSKWMPALPSGSVHLMFTCPCAGNVSPAGSVMPWRSTVYGGGLSDPPAQAGAVRPPSRSANAPASAAVIPPARLNMLIPLPPVGVAMGGAVCGSASALGGGRDVVDGLDLAGERVHVGVELLQVRRRLFDACDVVLVGGHDCRGEHVAQEAPREVRDLTGGGENRLSLVQSGQARLGGTAGYFHLDGLRGGGLRGSSGVRAGTGDASADHDPEEEA